MIEIKDIQTLPYVVTLYKEPMSYRNKEFHTRFMTDVISNEYLFISLFIYLV